MPPLFLLLQQRNLASNPSTTIFYHGHMPAPPCHPLPHTIVEGMHDAPPTWILHLDMDAFFASVEQLDFPAYRGKPVIIGAGERGVVSTCSYEARKFGVHSAMPTHQAKKLCPRGIFVHGRMERYSEVSQQIMSILDTFSPLVEKASVDEAYLDLTGLETLEIDVMQHARSIQQAIFDQVGLTCSMGLAPIKFLAKIASDLKKPAGFTIITPEQVSDFLQRLPVRKIPGVGKQTFAILESLNVHTGKDVLRFSKNFWQQRLGKGGEMLFDRASGIDPRPVVPYYEPKSESAENTFYQDVHDRGELKQWLFIQAERVGKSLRKHQLKGRTITIKIKYNDFTQITRSKTLKENTHTTNTIYNEAVKLLDEVTLARPVRLIGVGVSQFDAHSQQLSLFQEQGQADAKELLLDETLDQLQETFGKHAILRGKSFLFHKKQYDSNE